MEGTIVRCPECEARLRVPPEKTAVRCPKCKAVVRVPPLEPPEEELEEVVAVEEPRRPKKRPRRDDDEDEDDRPRRRRDEDDEDDRPRRKRKREPVGEGPWLIAAGATAAAFAIGLGGTFLINGRAGLPAGQDGPGAKLAGLGFLLLVSLVLMPLGVVAVKNRLAYGRWGYAVEGTWGVVLGFIQALFGGFMSGLALYGLITTLANGR